MREIARVLERCNPGSTLDVGNTIMTVRPCHPGRGVDLRPARTAFSL